MKQIAMMSLLALTVLVTLTQYVNADVLTVNSWDHVKQRSYYQLSIHDETDKGVYLSSVKVYGSILNHTFNGTTDKFGNFVYGFYLSPDEKLGEHIGIVYINDHTKSLDVFVLHWVQQTGP